MTERIFKTIGKDGIKCDQPCFVLRRKDVFITHGKVVCVSGDPNYPEIDRYVCTATGAPLIEGRYSMVPGDEKFGDIRTCQLVEEALAKMTE